MTSDELVGQAQAVLGEQRAGAHLVAAVLPVAGTHARQVVEVARLETGRIDRTERPGGGTREARLLVDAVVEAQRPVAGQSEQRLAVL